MSGAGKEPLHEGDGVLLFCEKANGFIFSPPPLDPEVSSVSIHSIDDITNVSHPGFTNVHYASFVIQPRTYLTETRERGLSKSKKKDKKELVYGRKVLLYHAASKLYLGFVKRGAATKSRLQMASLVDGNDGNDDTKEKPKPTVFRILPSDPHKSTGQQISAEDSVRLEILGDPGQKAQVLCMPNLLNFKGYDLKKASDGSDFVLYSQSTGEKLGPPLALRGGEVLMFLNEKRDAFLTVLSNGDRYQVGAKVNDSTSTRMQFTGGDSYWQIESAKLQYDGNWVDLDVPWDVRIKHLPTKHYLVVEKSSSEEKFALQQNGDTDDSLFRFEEDQQDPDQGLMKRRYVLIKHVKTDTYVTLDGKSGHVVDGSRCFEITPRPSIEAISDHRDQKFWIEEVDEEILKKFSALSGAFIVLKEYLEKLEESQKQEGGGSVVAVPTDTLDTLADWTGNKSGVSSREKWPDILRAIEGVELVLKFLSKPVDSTTARVQKKLCIVLENYIKAASEESQLYLISKGKLLDTLFPLMSQNIGAEDVLSALIKCRSFGTREKVKVLKRFFQEPEFILKSVLEDKQDFEFLKCLGALCLSGGRQEKKIQNELLDKIIIPGHTRNIFFKINRAGNGIVSVQLPKMFQDDHDADHLNQLLIVQLEFYTSVCQGVNLYCIEKMTEVKDQHEDELLTYDAASLCLGLYQNSPAVQSAFYGYLVAAMVDKNAEESGTDLDNIWYIYSWSRFLNLDKPYQPVILSGIANTHDIISDEEQMIKIQNQIQDSLETENWQNDLQVGREELMTQKLCVLETLVAFGFYWMADDKEGGTGGVVTGGSPQTVTVPSPGVVIRALIDILGYGASKESPALTRLQSKAIDVLNLFLHQTYHLGTSRLMFDYRYFAVQQEQLSDSNQRGFTVPKSFLSQLTDKDFNVERHYHQIEHIPGVQQHLIKQRITEACNRLKWVLYEQNADLPLTCFPGQSVDYFYDYKLLNVYEKPNKLLTQLVRFLDSKDEGLCLGAARLLFDLFRGETFLFDRSEKSLVVMESSFETYTTMVKYATYQDKVEGRPVRALLRLLQGKGADPDIKPSIISFANDVIDTAGNPPGSTGLQPRDETFTKATGQSIVLTTGVYGVLLNYVLKYSVTDDPDQEELVSKVCEALRAIARGNNQVKEVVFARFDDLLNAKLGIKAIAHLLTEVLTDNIDACRRLLLGSIRKMFRMIAIKDSDGSTDHYEFMPTIEAWIKVSKSSPQLLKVHQRFVCELFEQFFKDYYETGWNPETSPVEMLRKDDNDKFILFTHMLGVCVEGIHKYCEDVVRGVFRFSALAQIIVDEKLPLEKRLPFVMLLNEGYLKTERESLISVMDFAQSRLLWSHIEAMTQFVVQIREKLASIENKKTGPSKKTLACQKIKLRILFSQHMTHMHWREHRIPKISNSSSLFKEEEVIGEGATEATPLSVLYQYLIEGLLPCLSTFAEEYKILWTLYKDRLTGETKPLSDVNMNLLKNFGHEMETLVKTFPNIFVSTQHQLVYWTAALKPIQCIDHDPEVYSLDIEPADYKIEKSPNEKDEERVNNGFQTYLKNFKELVHCNDTSADQAGLYPTGPGYQRLLTNMFPPETCNSRNVEHLVKLLKILHKQVQHSHDNKETLSLNQLIVNIMQLLSGVLHREADDTDEQQLCNWQKVFIMKEVHKTCMLHMSHPDIEIVLQILGLLQLITLNANLKAQDLLYEEISNRDSVFCTRVYMLLEDVVSTFKETWARHDNRPLQQKEQRCKSAAERSDNGGEGDTSDAVNLLSAAADSMEQETTLSTDMETADSATGGTLALQSLDSGIRIGSIVLECVSALCDGQHRKLQCFLLDQEKSFKKLDIIKKIAILLDVLTEEYSKALQLEEGNTRKRVYSYLDLMQKALQALIETTAGNYSNQQAVFQCQITDTINYLLGSIVDTPIYMDGWSHEDQDIVEAKKKELSCKAIELLQVLLEETHDKSVKLIADFSEDVDLDAIIKAMLKWKDIGAYHILRLVANSRGISVDILVLTRMNGWNPEKQGLWNDFKARSRCIEVLYQPDKDSDDKILTRVYFDFDPLNEVREEDKETVTNAITEESQEENLTEFNEWGRSIRRNAKYMYKNFLNKGRMIWVFRLIYEFSGPRHFLLVLLTVLLNLLALFVTVAPSPSSSNDSSNNFILPPSLPMWYFPILLPVLGILHTVLSVWMVVEYIIKEVPNFTRDVFFVTAIQSLWKSFKRWVSQQEMFCSICPKDWRLRQKRRDIQDLLTTDENGKTSLVEDPEDLYYYEDEDEDGYFKVDIFGFQSVYRFVFLICSIAAIPLRGYPYCICLFYVFLRVDVVQYILTALSRSRKQLLFVGMIAAGVLLVFGVVAFVFLQDHFNETDDNPLFCNTLWECFVSVSREGLLDTLGPAIPFGDSPSYPYYAIRTIFYDLPFFLIVTTIVLNIVTAVLIDRFSDLREERDAVESKKMKACFICGIETEKFERDGKGFRDHVKEDHNRWNYIYYLIYLDRKPENDRTALEKQIADNNKIDKRYGKTDHYPIGQAKVFQKDNQEE